MIVYLTLLCFGSWGLLAGLTPGSGVAVFWGMLGPWLVGSISLVLVRRIYAKDPEALTPLMLKAFLGKMVFYAVYISLLVLLVELPKIGFILSFTVYFIVLHIIEALYFQAIFKPKKP